MDPGRGHHCSGWLTVQRDFVSNVKRKLLGRTKVNDSNIWRAWYLSLGLLIVWPMLPERNLSRRRCWKWGKPKQLDVRGYQPYGSCRGHVEFGSFGWSTARFFCFRRYFARAYDPTNTNCLFASPNYVSISDYHRSSFIRWHDCNVTATTEWFKRILILSC